MSEDTKKAPEQEQPEVSAEPKTPDEQAPESTDEAPAEEAEKAPQYKVSVEDAGTLRKKVTIDITREQIDGKFKEMFGELRKTAQVPGFRIGHAPSALIEKRFGKDVSEDVRNSLLGESIGEAIEGAGFKALGEPDLKLEDIELPDAGDMSFQFELEVEPEFDLPATEGIEVKRPIVIIDDERVQHAIDSFRSKLATLKPIEAAAAEGDFVVADVSVTGEDISETTPNLELRVAPGMVTGIPLEDLPSALAGKKSGETSELKAIIPAAHPNEAWREKDVTIGFEIKEVKQLELPEMTDELAGLAGFESLQDMQDSTRAQLESRVESEQTQIMRDQICSHLLAKADFDVPPQAAERSASRLLSRRCVDMMMQGVPREEIERNMDQLELESRQQAAGRMKLSFILGRYADNEEIYVTDDEVNSRIAELARSQKRRPERMRQEMRSDGSLETLTSAILDEKAIDRILETAKITDARPEEKADEAKPAKKDEKKPKAKSAARTKASGTKTDEKE